MFFAPIAGFSLVVSVALDVQPRPPVSAPGRLSAAYTTTLLKPFERAATECVARAVAHDPRAQSTIGTDAFAELIVESVPPCRDVMHVLIDNHDRLFGEGSGAQYFLGPFLDMLPQSVEDLLKAGIK